ncbi:uncharacterized protein ARMOST_12382 [Armillaria ostoyae]|uniref:Fungal-type protein kinase domain-containing protein n=1 Tax=Armillaria ostoyae TaxID=47428 RepID=A0A284RJS5_ARMOS|nr:uncharacterized protein ARMOST_12382 [Armillaria ostoyae]
MSLNNMMYRRRSNSKGKFCILGVLNDFDLSSSLPLKEAASLHRTGTPPYMAYDLLGQSDVGHLYRHDVEAFYYVLLMLCCRYEIVQSGEGKVMRELQSDRAELPFAQWFDRTKSWTTLAYAKHTFLTGHETISVSKSFSVFLPWLDGIRYLFGEGMHALTKSTRHPPPTRQRSHSDQPRSMEPSVPFDNETLGGYIISTEILEIISDIGGHSLVIKNNQ